MWTDTGSWLFRLQFQRVEGEIKQAGQDTDESQVNWEVEVALLQAFQYSGRLVGILAPDITDLVTLDKLFYFDTVAEIDRWETNCHSEFWRTQVYFNVNGPRGVSTPKRVPQAQRMQGLHRALSSWLSFPPQFSTQGLSPKFEKQDS